VKVVHWRFINGSGLSKVAEELSEAENNLGITSVLADSNDEKTWEDYVDGDIHVVHSHFPDEIRKKHHKTVWVGHGTPEHCWKGAMDANTPGAWMLSQYWMQHSDALVTFWPRQQAVWKTLCDKNTKVEYIPMGINTDFWKPVESRGKYAGEPSLLCAENPHDFKWPFDIFVAWPWVTEKISMARFHAYYIPKVNEHYWKGWTDRNGASFRSYIHTVVLAPEDLRNAFVSSDYYISPVRYGDYNRVCLEAKASGTKLISYQGNPYADYWITAGDQRIMADELIRIFKGEIEPLKSAPIPTIEEMAQSMINVYKRL
jgi:glycosyltransferase involved in cell wall biosynthesis